MIAEVKGTLVQTFNSESIQTALATVVAQAEYSQTHNAEDEGALLLETPEPHQSVFSFPNLDTKAPFAAPWAQDALDALKLAQIDKKRTDLAEKRIATAMADYALQRQAMVYENLGIRDRYIKTYMELSSVLKKKNYDQGALQQVYINAVPQLLAMNGVSEKAFNEQGINSIAQIVSIATTMVEALDARAKGEQVEFRIFSQMCAQYNSGSVHEAESFTRGLVEEFDQSKIDKAYAHLKGIASVLTTADIPVTIITPQVTADAELTLALVPVAVRAAIKEGRLGEFLQKLNLHAVTLPGYIQKSLAVEEHTLLQHEAPSYRDVAANDGKSIIGTTITLAERLGELQSLHNKYYLKGTELNHWTEISSMQLQMLLDHQMGDSEHDLVEEIAAKNGWDSKEREMIEIMLRVLAPKDSGALTDTVKFYSRAQGAGEEYANFDFDSEVEILLQDPYFYPEAESDIRLEKAQQTLTWIQRMNKIGVGARAAFNAALYVAMGKHLADLNGGKDERGVIQFAIMLPQEEDVDRWSSHGINLGYRQFNGVYHDVLGTDYMAPFAYARKEDRQPYTKSNLL